MPCLRCLSVRRAVERESLEAMLALLTSQTVTAIERDAPGVPRGDFSGPPFSMAKVFLPVPMLFELVELEAFFPRGEKDIDAVRPTSRNLREIRGVGLTETRAASADLGGLGDALFSHLKSVIRIANPDKPLDDAPLALFSSIHRVGSGDRRHRLRVCVNDVSANQ